jgi:poly-gamma-glutamate capsule biosynthesis protein CapA/YwtB (metallophosphatase superfamily)
VTRRFVVALLCVWSATVASTAGQSLSPAVTQRPAHAAVVPAPETTITVAASGDLLIHQPLWQRAKANASGKGYDFRPMFRYVRPILRGADVALCHQETPLEGGAPAGYPRFRTPPALAGAVRWAGWDVCSTASNHSVDDGQAGIDATAKAFDRAGVRHTGSFRSAAARSTPTILDVRGIKVAFMAYTEMTNGIPLPHPWSVNIARASRIIADAKHARRLGAQVVIVNLHWGQEYQAAPTGFQRTLAAKLMASPAITAVVGQHVHVVQPIERVRGRIVVFGEGNLLSNQTPGCCAPGTQDGLIALLRITVTAKAARLTGVRYIPTWIRHPDFTVIPIETGLREHLAPASVLRASWRRTVARAGRSHAIQPIPFRLPRG